MFYMLQDDNLALVTKPMSWVLIAAILYRAVELVNFILPKELSYFWLMPCGA